MSYTITAVDLENMIYGGAFFGSGGGGTVISALNLLSHFKNDQAAYYPSKTVEIVSVEEVDPALLTVMVAYMGAPEVINKSQYPVGPCQAITKLQNNLTANGQKLGYVISPESGALGFLVACLVAAKFNLKVIDGDGAGRAVPELPMLSYAAAEIDPRPTILANQTQDGQCSLCVELNVDTYKYPSGHFQHQQDISTIIEQLLRPITAESEFGNFGGLAMWVMERADLQKAIPESLRGTLSRARLFGEMLRSHQITEADQAINFLNNKFNLKAKIIAGPCYISSVETNTSNGFDTGSIILQSIDEPKTTYRVLYQNESLMLWSNAEVEPLVIAPDSISYFILDDNKQYVYSNGDIVASDNTIYPDVQNKKIFICAWTANPVLQQGLIMQSFYGTLQSLGYFGNYRPLN